MFNAESLLGFPINLYFLDTTFQEITCPAGGCVINSLGSIVQIILQYSYFLNNIAEQGNGAVISITDCALIFFDYNNIYTSIHTS